MRSPKRGKSKERASTRRPGRKMGRAGTRTPKTHLLNAKVTYGAGGKIDSADHLS